MSKETVQTALQKRADQIAAASDMLTAKTRDWQTIKLYLTGRLEDGLGLTSEQQAKLARYQFIYNQLVSGKYTEQEVLQSVVKIYQVGLPQAYEDKAATQELFCSVLSVNKRFEFKMLLELSKDMHRKCATVGDTKGSAAYGKLIKDILKELEEPEEDLSTLYEGHTIEAVFDPTLLGAEAVDMKEVLKAINAKRDTPVKLDLFIEDIEHEEVTDGGKA